MATPLIKHAKVSGKAAGPNADVIYGPDWNQNHIVTGLENVPNVDTTNASNLTSGTVPAARLPSPTSSTLGGVKSLTASISQFLTSIGTDGIPTKAQPSASDIIGLAPSATTDTTNAANISSGTLAVVRGGTGQSTVSAAFDALSPNTTRGDITFRNATTNARLAAGTAGFVLQSNGVGTDPTWVSLPFSNISGTASIAQGGTGQVSASAAFDVLSPNTTRGDIIFRNATTNARLAAGTSGNVLRTNGAGADPTWVSLVKGDVGLVNVDNTSDVNKPVSTAQAVADAVVTANAANASNLTSGTVPTARLSYAQSGTGAVVRTMQDKMREIFSVTDFGAVGDGATDDLAKFNLAIAALTTAGGGVLWIPAKTFFLSDQVVITNSAITVVGMDKHNSRLLFGSSATGGIRFNQPVASGGADFQGVVVENLTILTQNTTAAAGKIAISYVPAGPEQGAPFETVTIRGVEIRGQNGFTHFWNYGIYAQNAVNVIIDDVNILGKFNTKSMEGGVYTDFYAISVSVLNSTISYVLFAVKMYSNNSSTPPAGAQVTGTEGIQVIGCLLVGVGAGVVHDNGTNVEPRPLLLVNGCHINASDNCIVASNCTETVVSGNLFYLQDMAGTTVPAGAACITINNPNASAVPRHAISGNIFRSLTSEALTRGIIIDTTFGAVSGCVFDNLGIGIILNTHSANWVLSGNIFNSMGTANCQNNGSTSTNYTVAKTALAGGFTAI